MCVSNVFLQVLTSLLVSSGLSLVEDYPYEPEERGSDYVRLASIAAGDTFTQLHSDMPLWMVLKQYRTDIKM